MDTQDMSGIDPAGLIAARRRLIDMHHRARVGHLGGNLSALDAIWVLFQRHLDTEDRFILSKGHSAGALYVALWSVGRLSDAELDTFHAEGTRLPGHPPCQGLPDVPFATGSLGHGLSLAAGTALAHRLQGRTGHVYCLTSDGEWQEGSTWEALVFARHHRLDGLTILVDHNGLQGFGRTADVASMDPLWERLAGFESAPQVIDGHDLAAIDHALRQPPVAG
ncbi:MAG: hypothetical protein RLY78_2257, partial [Pseudomonadota bacterium]